jgi:hypothetical protein
MAILQGAQTLSSCSTVYHPVQAIGTTAGQVLNHLDRSCKTLVLVGCLDEIFFYGPPVLVGAKAQSMVRF